MIQFSLENKWINSGVWTLLTIGLAFLGEMAGHYVLKLFNIAIFDSAALKLCVRKGIDFFETIKMFHYSVLIISAVSVEYLLHLSQHWGKYDVKKNFFKIIGNFIGIVVIFSVSFYFIAAHDIHNIMIARGTFDSATDPCKNIANYTMSCTLVMTFYIRLNVHEVANIN